LGQKENGPAQVKMGHVLVWAKRISRYRKRNWDFENLNSNKKEIKFKISFGIFLKIENLVVISKIKNLNQGLQTKEVQNNSKQGFEIQRMVLNFFKR
jgi:ribosome-associated toxin RatA of RatAB toxin-antitoxin module